MNASAKASDLHRREVIPESSTSTPITSVQVTPTQLFGVADNARDAGDFATAEIAYRALATNPDIELRTEARFRLAMMLADRNLYARRYAISSERQDTI